MPTSSLAIVTICSNNYIPNAKVLMSSVRLFHPEAALFHCLADKMVAEPGFYEFGCTMIEAEQLGIPDFTSFAFRYDVLEFNTALKPFVIRHLMDELDFKRIVYLDPDIQLFRPLDSLLAPLASEAFIVLTPHLLSPAEGLDQPDDIAVMKAGIYNLGFIAFARCEETRRVIAWWARRLRFQCVRAQDEGIFVDQKFIDLVPGFARVHVSRDPTVNVAYWNLRQRRLTDANDGGWLVDGLSLTFFHYSRFDPRHPGKLSRFSQEADSMPSPLRRLTEAYAQRLLANGHESTRGMTYAYGRFNSGTPIPYLARKMFRACGYWLDDPFETFEGFMDEASVAALHPIWKHRTTNFMKFLHEQVPRFSMCLDLSRPEHVQDLSLWFVTHAANELNIDPRLVESAAQRMGERRTPARRRLAVAKPGPVKVAVVGYLRAVGGVGEIGRQTLLALQEAGAEVQGLDINANAGVGPKNTAVEALIRDTVVADTTVFNINADQLPSVIAHLGDRTSPNALRICIPFWELSRFPEPWLAALREMDEIWAPSRFIQMTLAPRLDKPVMHMPVAVELPTVNVIPRFQLGLPDRRFLFYVGLDFRSFVHRKNPSAAIAAFKAAFSGLGQAGLVIKCINGEQKPTQLAALRHEIDGHPDIFLSCETLSRDKLLALMAATDAILSLHRSEGLGLHIAEGMLLGKPVIATDYSGSREFLSAATGYPVDYQLVAVAEDEYPFWQGQVWAEPDVEHAAWIMRRLAGNPASAAPLVHAGREKLRRDHSRPEVGRRQLKRLQALA